MVVDNIEDQPIHCFLALRDLSVSTLKVCAGSVADMVRWGAEHPSRIRSRRTHRKHQATRLPSLSRSPQSKGAATFTAATIRRIPKTKRGKARCLATAYFWWAAALLLLMATVVDVANGDTSTTTSLPATTAPPPTLTSTSPRPTQAGNTTTTSAPRQPTPQPYMDLQPSASSNPLVLGIVGGISGLVVFSAGGWLYYRISTAPSEEVASPEEDDDVTATPLLEETVALGDDDPDILMLGEARKPAAPDGVDHNETATVEMDDSDVDPTDERQRPKRAKQKAQSKKNNNTPSVAIADNTT